MWSFGKDLALLPLKVILCVVSLKITVRLLLLSGISAEAGTACLPSKLSDIWRIRTISVVRMTFVAVHVNLKVLVFATQKKRSFWGRVFVSDEDMLEEVTRENGGYMNFNFCCTKVVRDRTLVVIPLDWKTWCWNRTETICFAVHKISKLWAMLIDYHWSNYITVVNFNHFTVSFPISITLLVNMKRYFLCIDASGERKMCTTGDRLVQ